MLAELAAVNFPGEDRQLVLQIVSAEDTEPRVSRNKVPKKRHWLCNEPLPDQGLGSSMFGFLSGGSQTPCEEVINPPHISNQCLLTVHARIKRPPSGGPDERPVTVHPHIYMETQ